MAIIVLFTDFGPAGPYTGQVEAVLRQMAPMHPVINLLSNAPVANPRASSYLLAALRHSFPGNSIFLAVIDPGVGSERKAVVLHADGQYFVGPDNGLLNTVAAQSRQVQWFEIIWRPEQYSMSFHGRDLFAPISARLACNTADGLLKPFTRHDLDVWPEDLSEVVYFDHYGNAMTGLRYHEGLAGKSLTVSGIVIEQADTFSAVAEHQAFWYRNSSGLVEIAVNQASAQHQLDLQVGVGVSFSQ
jgi:S-adenosylmethionine hydrolase